MILCEKNIQYLYHYFLLLIVLLNKRSEKSLLFNLVAYSIY